MNNAGFWGEIKKPILCLAPMADVTDCVFRQIIAKYSDHGKIGLRGEKLGGPDVFWTEFVSADGLCSPGREKLLVDLSFIPTERPIVAQIFGSKPENIRKAALLCRNLGFDGVDINMGCPDRSIEKQGAGAAMIKNPMIAKEVIQAAQEGAGDIPVSVKTRIGYNKNELETWLPEILSMNVAALTVHLRTRKEMSNVSAHWDLMKDIVEIRNRMKKETLVFGNGDVPDIYDAEQKCKEYGCDGVMLGRAIFGNPWLFKRLPGSEQNAVLPIAEKLRVMMEHTRLFEKMLGSHKNFAIMKKHYKAYVNGFDGAKELRMRLMEAIDAAEVEAITNDFLANI